MMAKMLVPPTTAEAPLFEVVGAGVEEVPEALPVAVAAAEAELAGALEGAALVEEGVVPLGGLR